jgi:hypothetical protein
VVTSFAARWLVVSLWISNSLSMFIPAWRCISSYPSHCAYLTRGLWVFIALGVILSAQMRVVFLSAILCYSPLRLCALSHHALCGTVVYVHRDSHYSFSLRKGIRFSFYLFPFILAFILKLNPNSRRRTIKQISEINLNENFVYFRRLSFLLDAFNVGLPRCF